MTIRPFLMSASLSVLALGGIAHAASGPSAAAQAQVLDLSKQIMAMRSVAGEGNETGKVAAAIRDTLVAGGWAAADSEIVPVGDTAYLLATWKGRDPRLKPLVLSGHMDVVEARRADWVRDPFVPVVENGYLFGRGATDMKFNAALAVSSLIDLRKAGYKPRRTIIVAFSGDEETTMKTSQLIAERLKNAELVINVDGGGGKLDETTAKPLFWAWDGAEKTYADYKLEVTNAGGHSSAPRADNAIVQLSTALERIGGYHFAAEQNPLTKAYFERAAAFEPDAKIAAAMRAFAANPGDQQAIDTLRANPATVGKVGTTCVPTMVNGGHALNALPQRATANINCRIFPGHKPAAIMAELQKVAGVSAVTFTDVTEGSIASPASPMRADFVKAAEGAIRKAWPGVAVIPVQASGASDSMWYRAVGVPAYGASPVFTKDSEDFSHGLNERVPLSNIKPGLIYFGSLFTDLSK
ncbi:M20/M25/M40 family metallo-hydrolase [Novosphingobium sp. KCTC 2891]|uniref:M20/M25/M40 family metallo-hydrolase n=1 Tax=Novosphingobium sp. KCTC 2891 TaxID=2989730 RepID=UPI0022235976|nr:M20/M25/M40 family metallo-hydrolase [Novosphingobium sp. KCTC 2891]MCW1381407.1 M20/M25/M40 family metallo-hydrolase [Novosphingobium sp. KCTC 2891]